MAARDLTSNGVADITFGAIEVVDADRRDKGSGVHWIEILNAGDE